MAAEVGQAVLSVRRYEAGPPANLQVDGGDTYATTKEEEWVTKKKTELTTTRQIETRVKRQVVLEDGHVVEDSGPVVTTNTTEDTKKQEQKSTEHRTTGDDPPGPEWLAVASPGPATIKEVTERTVKTRDEQEDRTETEDVAHLGDISDDTYLAAVTSGEDLRDALSRDLVVSTGPRVVHQSSKTRHVVDTADSTALSELQPDGRVVTETRRTTEHEEDNDEETPDNDAAIQHSDEEETRKESSHRYVKTKDQDLVEYLADGVKIGQEMRYNAENVEGERTGDPGDMALHQQEWDSLSSRIRRMRRQGNKATTTTTTTPARGIPAASPGAVGAAVPLDRKDALTKKPLDFDQEEETRKVETSKWLTHHFGSESRSSKDSMDEDDGIPAAGHNTSFINVTMKSRPIPGRVTSPVNGATHQRLGATSSTPVNGNSTYFSNGETSFISRSHNGVTSPVNGHTRFTRISSPLGDDVSPTFVSNTRSSGFSSPVNGFSRNTGIYTNGNIKSSNVSSPVNSTSTPKSYMATVNSSSRVYVSSPESEEPPRTGANGYFQGVSEWTERRNDHVQETRQTFSPPPINLPHHPDRIQVLPTGPSHTFAKQNVSSPYNSNNHLDRVELNSPTSRNAPYHSGNLISSERRVQHHLERASPLQSVNRVPSRQELNQTSYQESRQDLSQSTHTRQENHQTSSYVLGGRQESRSRESPMVNGDRSSTPTRPLMQRELRNASPAQGRNGNGWAEHEEDGYRGYHSSSIHQQNEPNPDYLPTSGGPAKEFIERDSPQTAANKKMYQRTRFAADIPPPPTPPTNRATTRSKSPGNIIGDSFRKLVGKFRSRSSERKIKRNSKTKMSREDLSRSPSPHGHTYQQYNVIDNNIPAVSGGGGSRVGENGGEVEEQPVAPPRVSRAAANNNNQKHLDAMERSRGTAVVQRYYLGEDPFGGSIYGREKEYDGVTPVKRRSHHRQQNGHRRGSNEEDDMNRANVNLYTTNSSTLGRLSKSTSRLVNSSPDYTRTSQTLPRKLQHYEEHRVTTPTGINVSIVNNVSPPKPARTYRSNLSRSQSFNVQPTGGVRSGVYTSNPSLNRIGESPAPLKSPAILASISRSQKDLTAPIEEEETPRFTKSTSNLLNGSPPDTKKEIFMQGLMDRAPELFKTLHGEDDSRHGAISPQGRIYTSPVRHTRVEKTTSTTTTTPIRNGYSGYNPNTPLRNGLILDSTHSTGSSAIRNRLADSAYTTTTPLKNGRMIESPMSRINGTTPLRSHRIVESSNSFRSSSTNDSDPVRHLSSPYRQPVNGDRVGSPSLYAATQARVNSPSLYSTVKGDRINTPSPGFSTSLVHSNDNGVATSRSVERRGSGDDFTETVRILSKNDDPVHPSETNTIKSFSKKRIPTRDGSGRATETMESSETTTVTKSRFRGGAHEPLSTAYPSRNGSVVIEVRPGRK